jgi:hypothetical protein
MSDILETNIENKEMSGARPLDLNEPCLPGGLCPKCNNGKLDYNGLFELECLACGFIDKRAAECTCSFRADAV